MSAAKLLLVEDDPALSELLEYRFQNEGYNVRCTGDGDEALVLAFRGCARPYHSRLDDRRAPAASRSAAAFRREQGNRPRADHHVDAREAEDDRVRWLGNGRG